MEKKIRKKYYSEEAVKKALQIDSFRNLSKEKVMENMFIADLRWSEIPKILAFHKIDHVYI